MKTTQQNHPLQAECARAANDWDKLLTPKTTHTQDGDAEPCDADRVTAILVAAIDRATRN